MVVKNVTIAYLDCQFCKVSSCLSSYQPTLFMSLEALQKGSIKTCVKCGKRLGIASVKATLVEKE
jgi:hypothetical protein